MGFWLSTCKSIRSFPYSSRWALYYLTLNILVIKAGKKKAGRSRLWDSWVGLAVLCCTSCSCWQPWASSGAERWFRRAARDEAQGCMCYSGARALLYQPQPWFLRSLLPPRIGIIKGISLAAFKPIHIRKAATKLLRQRNARGRLMVLNPLWRCPHAVEGAPCTSGMCKSVCPAAC